MPLNDIETRIIKMVVDRFMKLKDATKRKDLMIEFKSPQAIDRLIKVGILRVLDNDGNLIPSSFGVECSKDSDSVTRAKLSLGLVLQALQNLYCVTPSRKQITRNDVLLEVNRIQGNTTPDVIARGLYFIKEFPVLDSYGPSPGQPRPTVFDLEWMVISERIVTVDVNNAWDEHIRDCAATLESITDEAETLEPGYSQPLDDRAFAQLAIEEARKSAPEDDRIHPKVGVVVVKGGRVLASAHRGEIPQCHAEFIALEKKLSDEPLSGATVYTTLEPCTSRNHPKVPCAVRLTERKVGRVVIGMLDPDDRISGRGQRALRKAGIATELFPNDLMAQVEELNRDFVRDRESRENHVTKMPTGQEDREAEYRQKQQAPPHFYNFGGNPGSILLSGMTHSVQGPWVDARGLVTIVNPTQSPMKIALHRLVLAGKECAVHRFFFQLKSKPMEKFERISLMGNSKEDYEVHVMFTDAGPTPPSGDGELWVSSDNRLEEFPVKVRLSVRV